MTRRFEHFARAAHRASRALAAPSAFAALAGLAACTDAPQPTGPARPGRPSLTQVATGPVVTSTADPGDGTCDEAGTGDGCTLREAIAFGEPGATITFAAGVTGTITLTQGQLTIDKALTISGPGARRLAVSGNNASRVFRINVGVGPVTLVGLTIASGRPVDDGPVLPGPGGGIITPPELGGGIFNGGTLTLIQCTVTGNRAEYGGGILNDGTLTLTESTVSGNIARDLGGGIYSSTSTDLTTTSTTILNSTVSGNWGLRGGGGVHNNRGLTRILHSTVTANQALNGGGLESQGVDGTRTEVQGSVVAGNTDGGTAANDLATRDATVQSRYQSLGYNVVGAAGANVDFTLEFNQTGDQTGVTDPAVLQLGPLADNGGPTNTHAVLAGSAALDKGGPAFDPSAFTPPLATDQRGTGFARVSGGRIDVGAFELQQPKLTQTITFPAIAPNPAKVSGSATLGATASSGLTVSYSSLTTNVCTVSGTTVSYGNAGTCTVAADQAGNDRYDPATQATQSVEVIKESQTITFTSTAPAPAYVKGTYTVAASGGSSGNTIAITVGPPSVCTVTGNTVRFIGVGTCTVTANQAGNNAYAAAATVTQSVKVAYRFDGFLGAVKNGDVLNVAKAGQVIPLQWRLTDASGAPITTLTAVQITATDLNCALGATGGQVAEQASGASGLQNLGNGYYQYNWKSPVSYANSCKTLRLDLGEGTGTRIARFAFTK